MLKLNELLLYENEELPRLNDFFMKLIRINLSLDCPKNVEFFPRFRTFLSLKPQSVIKIVFLKL